MFRFKFADAGNMSPPLISFSEVAFSYSGKKKDYLFKDISFGIHPSSRIVLVGPNGAGEIGQKQRERERRRNSNAA